MKVFRNRPKKNLLSRREALNYRPSKSLHISETRLDSGEVILEYPLAVKPWIAALARRFGGQADRVPTKKLQLDAMGTAVWDLMDGSRSVRRIVRIFAETHRLENKEAEVSVTSFIKQLGQRGLLGLR
jgi:hypothetical protein